MKPISEAEREAGRMLVLLIMKERHPEPTPMQELRQRFLEMMKDHGSAQAALVHLRRMQQQ